VRRHPGEDDEADHLLGPGGDEDRDQEKAVGQEESDGRQWNSSDIA
jgi:hypothetical protein